MNYLQKLESLLKQGYSFNEAENMISQEEYNIFYQQSLENNHTIN